MNRTLGGWVAWLLVFGLSGCGGESDQGDGNQSETAGESGSQAGDTSASTEGGSEEDGARQGGRSNGEGGGAEPMGGKPAGGGSGPTSGGQAGLPANGGASNAKGGTSNPGGGGSNPGVGGRVPSEGGASVPKGGAADGGSSSGASGSSVGGGSGEAGGTAVGEGGTTLGQGGGTVAEGGAAGVAAALDPMVYRAIAWGGESGERERLVVAAWDRSRCQCTWLLFGPQSYFPYDIGSGMWALTEARIGSDRDDCGGQMYSGGGDLADSVSGTVEVASDLSQVALDLEIGLAGVTVQTEVSGCVIGSIRDDCRRDNVPVTERTVVVREVCDGVEIELFNTEGFYVGALMNVLRIGEGCWYEKAGRSDGTSLLYLLTDEEFAALEDGVAIESEYGDCGGGTGNGDVYGTLDRASAEKY